MEAPPDALARDSPVVRAVKDIAFGSIAGMASKVFEHPFDLTKVRLQAQVLDASARFSGPIDCLRKTWTSEGVRGLYRGLPAPIVGAMAENASLFLVYGELQRVIRAVTGRPLDIQPTLPQLALAAAGAGMFTSFLLCVFLHFSLPLMLRHGCSTPIELVKCKMQVQMLVASPTAALPGPFAVLGSVVRSTGVRGLWLGHTGTMIRETGGTAAWFSTKEAVGRVLVSRRVKAGDGADKKLRPWESALSGACAGAAFNLALFPADSVKSAMQTEEELRPRGPGEKRPTFGGTARAMWKAQGVRGLYAGCGITVARSVPSNKIPTPPFLSPSPQSMPEIQTTVTPHNQQPYVTRTYPSPEEIDAIIANAGEAQKKWSNVPLQERIEIGYRFIEEFKQASGDLPVELTMQMGRPVSQGAGEVRGTVERATYMLSIAQDALKDVPLTESDKPGFRRFIKRVPLGVVFIIAPWNFPYLTSINAVLPALLAGNAVLLKPSPQTPCAAERLVAALHKAGVPEGVVRVMHLGVGETRRVVKSEGVHFVSFTGSVSNGREVQKAAAEEGFKGVGLELGGKDPAYVREDAQLGYTVAELVDGGLDFLLWDKDGTDFGEPGAFFNSGQSCCAIETYKLGDPTLPETNLGPVVSLASAARIRKQVEDAVVAGAKALVPEQLFPAAKVGTTYVAPQVLVDVDHSMDVMKEETFGPVVGIMKVSSDDEALKLMNDSPYGLTASIWTDAENNPTSEDAFLKLTDGLETGTVFLNRCDYLDPALAWTGVKDSGRGVSLSKFGECFFVFFWGRGRADGD
ncbi:hypothetical protein DXG01_012261 [Tephrocybe rancida]|nr:hypothetical protein DXG01_012261 [Tephrocybe rancida]